MTGDTRRNVAGIAHGPGEGEVLFGGRIVLKSDLAGLSVTESWFDSARPGAEPHLHHAHTDSFYVLEGELSFLVDDEEHLLGPGAFVSAPPEVVHGFRTIAPSRFLNLHTPDGGFAENLRARNRREPGGFDSVDVPPGSGLDASNAILLRAGEGERLVANHRVATILSGREDLSLIEFELGPGFEGPDAHVHDDHTDAFYVLEGEISFVLGEETFVGGPGSFVAAAPGVAHGFTRHSERSRLLNIHAPGVGFHDRLTR